MQHTCIRFTYLLHFTPAAGWNGLSCEHSVSQNIIKLRHAQLPGEKKKTHFDEIYTFAMKYSSFCLGVGHFLQEWHALRLCGLTDSFSIKAFE